MKEISLDPLEAGCVIVSITDALVAHYLEGDEMMSLLGAVALDSIGGKDTAVGEIERQSAKVIKVVVNSGNTDRAHAGENDRAVEGANVVESFRQPAVIVKPIKESNKSSHNKSRKLL